MAALHIDSLVYGRQGRALASPLSLQAAAGEVWAVLGENGVGKTTLLHTLARLTPPLQGKVFIDGVDTARCPRKLLARRLGLLLQQSSLDFPFTLGECVMAGRYAHRQPWQAPTPADQAAVDQALVHCGLAGREQERVQRLSGGEQRRLAIATLLAQDTGVLLLDEPINHLDLRYQATLMAHFCHLAHEQRRLVFMSVHDINLAARYADRVLLLYPDGQHAAGPATDMLRRDHLERVFRYPLREVGDGEQRFWIAQGGGKA